MAQKNRNTPTTKTTRVSAEQKYNDFVADLFIKSIESGTAPWTKPWSTEDMVNMTPRNPETGTFYKGSNAALLFMTEELNGYQDSRWMTFNQAKAAGGYVKAGEHGVPLRTFIFEREVPVLDDKGKPVLDKDGKQVTEIEELDPPIINTFTVFNVKQISFPPEHKYSQPLASDVTQEQVWENLQRAEDLIKNTNAQIVFGTGSRAFYAPAKDYINLPKKEKFKTQEGFYSTALHELSHWTGHKARLDRPYNSRFGTPNYAREELVAEISSFMLCMNLGIGHNLENHASYVESWSKILKDDKKEIIEATKKANEAQKFITSFSQNNILAEDRIYLISTKDEQNFEKQLIDLGAFYDISENKFYITKETHDLSKFSEFLPDKQSQSQNKKSELEIIYEKCKKERGYYKNIDFETFKKINDVLPEENNGLMYKNWFAWDRIKEHERKVDDNGWNRADLINGISYNSQALEYVLKEKEMPAMVFYACLDKSSDGEGVNVEKTFAERGYYLTLSEANKLLFDANKEAKSKRQYFENDITVVAFDKRGGETKLPQSDLCTKMRYICGVGGDKGDVIKHISDGGGVKIYTVPDLTANLTEDDRKATKLLDSAHANDLKKKNDKFESFLKENKFEERQKLKSSMSKLENLQTALNKAIKYLNDQTVKESLSAEEKQVYVGQLSDLIAHAETLKQLVELNQELDVKGIKADAVNSLDKRDEIGEQSEYRKMQERQEMNVPHKVNPAYADTYLIVPFYDKDEAKSLGAKWDRKIKHWYVPAGTDLNLFNKWKRADVAVNKYQREYELSEQKSCYLRNSKTSAMEHSKQVLATDKVKFRGR